jgi:hypothetical protein
MCLIAAVYGRFHYVLDTLAGAALAIAVVGAYRCCVNRSPESARLGRA